MKTHRDPQIRSLAGRLLGSATDQSREQAVQEYLPALGLSANAGRGKKHYQRTCAACHRAGDQGHALGPDLATLRTAGKESLLVNIIDPNREVAPNYVTYLVETRDGESHLGMIVNETSRNVTLRQGFGAEKTIPRAEITRMQSQGHSMMPEGLEGALDRQAMADLLEFITAGAEDLELTEPH